MNCVGFGLVICYAHFPSFQVSGCSEYVPRTRAKKKNPSKKQGGRTQARRRKITHPPYLPIMPINHRMHPHKPRPPPIRQIKMRQIRTVRIRPAGADQNRLYNRVIAQVLRKGFFHR